jgi:hypothetical protein
VWFAEAPTIKENEMLQPRHIGLRAVETLNRAYSAHTHSPNALKLKKGKFCFVFELRFMVFFLVVAVLGLRQPL